VWGDSGQVKGVSQSSPTYSALAVFMVMLCMLFGVVWLAVVTTSMYRAYVRSRAARPGKVGGADSAEAPGVPVSSAPPGPPMVPMGASAEAGEPASATTAGGSRSSRQNRVSHSLRMMLSSPAPAGETTAVLVPGTATGDRDRDGRGGEDNQGKPEGMEAGKVRAAVNPTVVNPLFVRLHLDRRPNI
jgi:hypothetical protein